jgi:F0F1-type ATP synthase assembly protein I
MSQEPAPRQPARPVSPGGPPSSSREADQAWRSFAYLLSGPLLYGGLGWLLDSWLDTVFLLPVGLVFGMALSVYLIWFRYGSR